MKPILETKNISKEFYGTLALDDVSISINEGELHAIVGENGAGKSTLMKILCGLYLPDKGSIWIKRKKAKIKTVRDSVNYGISIIFQEFNLMPDLTIAENIFIPDLKTIKKTLFLDIKNQKKETKKLLDKLNLDLSPDTLVGDLNVSEKQMIEIAKALSKNSDIIIMDEPTASLNNTEVEELYNIINILRNSGKTIVYVSHRMKEIFDLADRVTVLRDGKVVGTRSIKDVEDSEIINMMVGRNINNFYPDVVKPNEKIVLEVESLCKKNIFEDISFKLYEGETLGISGLLGCGRDDVAKAIYGLNNYESGTIRIYGNKVQIKNPNDAIKYGIQFLTDDRKDSGIFQYMNISDNLTFNVLNKLCQKNHIIISSKKEKEVVNKFVKLLDIHYQSLKQQVMFLSGGNQQKVLLGRLLATSCKIIILMEPTRGVDVGTKTEIYKLIELLNKERVSIIMISSDLPEMLNTCNRLLVMWDGRIVKEFDNKEATEQNVMAYSTGKGTYNNGVKL